MKKPNKKGYVAVTACAISLVLGSTMLLNMGTAFAGDISTGSMENIAIEQKSNDSVKGPKIDASLREAINQTIEYNKLNCKVEKIDLSQQEALYQSLKDKININKEDAKEIFKKNIYDFFGDSINTSDSKIGFLEVRVQDGHYLWLVAQKDEKNKKQYCCHINAMTGECYDIGKLDYTGLKEAGLNEEVDAGLIVRKDVELRDDKLKFYYKKAEEIINKNNVLNAKHNSIQEITLKEKYYMPIRPIVILNIKMKDGSSTEITFYTDTDELVGVSKYF